MKIWGLILLACLAAKQKKCDPVNDAAAMQLLPDYSGGELRLHRPLGVYMAGTGEHAHNYTKDVITEALKGPEPKTITVLGGGSGYVAFALRRKFPKAKIIVTDISPEAVNAMKANAELNGIKDIEFRESDVFEEVPEKSDLVVFVPPRAIVDPETLAAIRTDPITRELFNDPGRFDVGGKIMARFLVGVPSHLTPGGRALLMTDTRVHDGLPANFGSRLLRRGRWDPQRPDDGSYGVLEINPKPGE